MGRSLFPAAAPPALSPRPLIGLGAAAAAGWFALFQLVAYLKAGRFDYPFDDVYIHLSMASGIADGYYGLKNGEWASASSSLLYPFLLLPFPGTELQRLLPMVWNLIGVTASGALLGAAMASLSLSPNIARIFTLLMPITLNLAGLGFGGMEHTLHLVAALLCVFGLWIWLCDQRLRWWFVASLILAPMLRYEGLALSLLSVGAIALSGGSWRQVGALAAAILLPLVAFSLFLVALDLPPLPNSVRAKQIEAHLARSGMAGIWQNVRTNFDYVSGPLFFAACGLGLGLAALGRADRSAALLLGTATLAFLAHLIVGRTGWMHRYETYALLVFTAALLIAWERCRAQAPRFPLPGIVLLTVIMALHGLFTLVLYKIKYLNGPLSIGSQQGQMARLAREHLKAPVGINDLGYVAWNNPYRVLDLWGLASNDALELRKLDAPRWPTQLMEREGVDFAMVYDSWFDGRISSEWITLGSFNYLGGFSTVGNDSVSFYARDAQAAEAMRRAVIDWIPGLPSVVSFTFSPEWQP